MTKVVMGGLIEWHPMYNTIANVFSEKIRMFFMWPLTMAVLLIKMSVNMICISSLDSRKQRWRSSGAAFRFDTIEFTLTSMQMYTPNNELL